MNRLREAREYIGLSHSEVEGAMNLSTMALEDMEDGAMEPSMTQWDAFSTLYQRPVGWLQGEPEEPLRVPKRVMLDLAPGLGLSDRDALELARFAQFLQHRAKVRSLPTTEPDHG